MFKFLLISTFFCFSTSVFLSQELDDSFGNYGEVVTEPLFFNSDLISGTLNPLNVLSIEFDNSLYLVGTCLRSIPNEPDLKGHGYFISQYDFDGDLVLDFGTNGVVYQESKIDSSMNWHFYISDFILNDNGIFIAYTDPFYNNEMWDANTEIHGYTLNGLINEDFGQSGKIVFEFSCNAYNSILADSELPNSYKYLLGHFGMNISNEEEILVVKKEALSSVGNCNIKKFDFSGNELSVNQPLVNTPDLGWIEGSTPAIRFDTKRLGSSTIISGWKSGETETSPYEVFHSKINFDGDEIEEFGENGYITFPVISSYSNAFQTHVSKDGNLFFPLTIAQGSDSILVHGVNGITGAPLDIFNSTGNTYSSSTDIGFSPFVEGSIFTFCDKLYVTNSQFSNLENGYECGIRCTDMLEESNEIISDIQIDLNSNLPFDDIQCITGTSNLIYSENNQQFYSVSLYPLDENFEDFTFRFLKYKVCNVPFSIQESEFDEILIFPNPSIGRFQVKAEFMKNRKLRILNINGVTIHVVRFENENLNIKLDLEAGVYMLDFDGIVRRKLVIH